MHQIIHFPPRFHSNEITLLPLSGRRTYVCAREGERQKCREQRACERDLRRAVIILNSVNPDSDTGTSFSALLRERAPGFPCNVGLPSLELLHAEITAMNHRPDNQTRSFVERSLATRIVSRHGPKFVGTSPRHLDFVKIRRNWTPICKSALNNGATTVEVYDRES